MTAPILIVDDDANVRDSLRMLLETEGHVIRSYASAGTLLAGDVAAGACLIADVRMPEMDGLELQEEIARRGYVLPVIIITGHGDVPLAVRAMKAGAVDFIEKPFSAETILESIAKALAQGSRTRSRSLETRSAQEQLSLLTPREREVFDRIVAGSPNKVAAFELQISPRTVEIHRAHIMDKMRARSLSDLVRIALAATPPVS